MQRRNDDWEGFANLSPDSDKHKRIQLLFSSGNFEHLKARAIESRIKHQPNLPLTVKCDINLNCFTSGFNNVVLELAFSDEISWIARIPYQDFNDNDRISMLSEIATMKIIQEKTTIPIPRVFEFEASADQPFGYPYIIMEYLSGRILPNGLATTTPIRYRVKVA
ncbi:hypothetical protein THARTR1_10711 [Trichoderma harzianum]|uniref:Aminoglycoside phosphotransferase domain-containing protein n=1 Tax=Trichoderma harzianum TaxID=5544 RepID=A0A2K0TM55_TRIHA|nr:hypothetical protein THARTR1_10711 [Trichoderma harzianum]